MGFVVALLAYGAAATGAWAVAGTAGLIAALVLVLLAEQRLARWRATAPVTDRREVHRARR